MPTSYRYDVFLCHATADKPAVETLAHGLRDAGLKPFLDQWHLVPGQPWQEGLEKALEASRTVAVFLGPGGLGPWQHEEMRAALDQRAKGDVEGVIPVLLPRAREKDVPTFLARMTWVDFRSGLDNEEALHCLVCGIRGVAPEAGAAAAVVPYRSMAQRPEGFVERRELEAIVELLCAVPEDADATVAITTALRGAGGFGKTTLAQALAFDDRVRRTYPGRVARIRDLLRWWQGEDPPAFETPGAAGAQLREALAGERVLVVLDDVWKYAGVAPFRGLAPGSALLVTTRDSRTLPPGSRRVEVDAMEVSEAVKLLASGLDDAAPFAALASRLGEWPLLLKLVNRQLVELVEEGGLEVDEALREVGEGLDEAGLTAFDVEDHDARELAVSRTLEVGLRRLSDEDRERFAELAVFPEDTDVPLAVVERLWSLGHFATKKLCARLYDLSLLLRFERETATIRLHDVVRQYLLGEQREALPGLHRGLLERCRPASGRWSELPPEDDYLWRNLAHHLVAAGQGETLQELLLDFYYLRAKLDATDVNALLADYDALAGDAELRAVQGALRLSAHVLARDGEQLAGQLLGRLLGRGEPGIRRLLRDGAEGSWFRPRVATLRLPGGPLLRTLEGHTYGVEAVAVLDGRRVVSASRDHTLRVWDVETGEQLRVLEGHTSGVKAVAVLDQRRVVSGSLDGTLRVWDVDTGEQLRSLDATTWVEAVAVLDQRCVVSATHDGTMRVCAASPKPSTTSPPSPPPKPPAPRPARVTVHVAGCQKLGHRHRLFVGNGLRQSRGP